ncbi:MAG: FAD-dependent oxidoreductase [Acidobacteria bacterium]|nr:FAD-dependent oxidoreductase [Acidobacteriota bacterium]
MRYGWLSLFLPLSTPLRAENFDVIVVSGSSGGFGAALAAGRMGARVALIEDTPVLGGMLSNGISNIDTYSYESLSGIFEEFRARVKEYYRPVEATDPIFHSPSGARRPADYRGRQSNAAIEGGRWEPHAADKIFKQMMAEAPGVTVFYNTWATGVVLRGNRVAGVVTRNHKGESRTLTGKVVIDATHEGDIAAWAGVPCRIGREARSPLEPHAGDLFFFNGTNEIMEGSSGRQDAGVVSYGLRLCIKHYPEGSGSAHLLASPPPGYDPKQFEHASDELHITMPGNKAEMNKNPIGNEMQEVNWGWPEASREERAKLYAGYRDHALAFLYYLQHERGMRNIGLPEDEFVDNGHVPYRVFVREARRIVGEATMTEADVNPFITGRGLLPAVRQDSIAIGHYAIDSKPVRQKLDASTPEKGNGDFFLAAVTTPFQVPYGAIVPKNVEGLLVPVAMSATHVAFSAVRMDPTWMAMGQASGVAAVLSIRDNVNPRQVEVEKIQRELLRQRVRLMFYWDLPLDHPAYGAIQWLSLRKGVRGYPDRLFRPDQPVTRAEMAALAVNVFELWPSVTNFHFADVPWTHWALREIETLFDNRLLQPFGFEPRWPRAGGYDAPQNAGFQTGQPFGDFQPDKPATWGEAIALLRLIDARQTVSPGAGIVKPGDKPSPAAPPGSLIGAWKGREVRPDAPVTRGEVCTLLAAAVGWPVESSDAARSR